MVDQLGAALGRSSFAVAALVLALLVPLTLAPVPAAASDPAVALSPAGPAAAPASDEVDRVLVWFAPGADEDAILARHDAQRIAVDASLGIPFVPVQVPHDPGVAAAALREEDGVLEAEPDVLVQTARQPSDTAWPEQWAQRLVRAPRAWEVTVGRSDVVVAVLDTGVTPHPDLPAGALVPGYNTFTLGTQTADDDPGAHGTAVATVIAARGDNAFGTAGYCWRCRIMPVKVLDASGRGGIYNVVAGIDHASSNGARIINLSLVIGPDGLTPLAIQELRDAAARAEARGSILVSAAGNHGTSAMTYPSAIDSVVGVTANNREGQRMTYGAFGSWVDVTAPACHIVEPVRSTSFCGTSSAAPAVAGTLGLALTVDRQATPASLRSALFSSSTSEGYVRYGRIDTGRLVDRALPAAARRPAVAVAGDWNGDGRQTPGWFRDGTFYLRFRNVGGPPDLVVPYGRTGDVPLVGDWDGDGKDTLGIVRDGEWHLRNSLTAGPGQIRFTYGRVTRGDRPLVGDWNGDGKDTIGIVRQREWHLRDSHAGGAADRTFVYGRVLDGDVPLTGDWNGNGRDTVGIVRGDRWMLRDTLSAGDADRVFGFGPIAAGDQAVVGDWTGVGRSAPAVVRSLQTWVLSHTVGAGGPTTTFRTLPWSDAA